MIGAIVYLLCALTCVACAVLLLRAHRRSGLRLLFWSGWSFAIFALTNALLFLDLVVFTDIDMMVCRTALTLFGLLLLLYGLIWDKP